MTRQREAGGGAEIESMRRLRAVLKRSSTGLGIAASFVRVFSSSRNPQEREAVRSVLLGVPVEKAFEPLAGGDGSGELLGFITSLASVSLAEASRGAERLSSLFERWTLIRERRAMEKKVMTFRGILVSAVAGVVVGMLSTLAPVIAGFQLTLGGGVQPVRAFDPFEGALILLPSAVCLGLYLTPQRPYANVAVALASFAAVVYFLGPLASFSLAG
jgi:hypothetical protein